MNSRPSIKLVFIIVTMMANGSLLYPNDDQIRLIPFLNNQLSVKGQNWSIGQDKNTGTLYFANSRGLIVHDGINTTEHELTFNLPVRSVLFNNGLIFTGAYEEFGYWQANDSCNLYYHSLSSRIEIAPNDEIWKIYKHRDKIYFQSFTSIYVYDYQEIDRIKAPYTMLFMFPVKEGFIVQVLDHGLFFFNGKDKFTFIAGSELFKLTKLHGMIKTKSGLLLCTGSKGIYKYQQKQFKRWDVPVSTFLEENSCNNAMPLNNSTYIFGTILKGIVISDSVGNILQNISAMNGLNDNTVLSLYKGKDKIWMGLDNGVNYFDTNSQSTYYADINGKLGTVYGMIKDDNTLYVGTNHGLYTTKQVKNNIIPSFENINRVPGSTGQVWYLKKIDNSLFCGHNEGTFIIENGRLKKISDFTGGWNIQKYNNYLVSGAYTGIVVFGKDDGEWETTHKLPGFNEPTRHLEVDYMGYIWTSHPRKGIYKIMPGERLDTILDIRYYDQIDGKSCNIDVFKINNQIVFSTGNGFYTYDYIDDHLVPLDGLNKQLGKYQNSLQVTHLESSKYLFCTANEIAISDISIDMEAKIMGELQQEITFLPERDIPAVKMGNHQWLIPGRQGIYLTRLPTDLKDPESTVFFEKIIARGNQNNLYYCNEIANINLPYITRSVEIHFGDMSLSTDQNNKYLYRVKQIDNYWYPTTRGTINLLNLNRGTYDVEIKNVFSGAIKKISFYIKKPWYISLLALVFYAFILLTIVYLFHLFFQHQIRKHRYHVANEVRLKNLARELDFKSYELTLTIRYLIKKNEILSDLKKEINEVKNKSSRYPLKSFNKIDRILERGLETQTKDWKHALDNLKLSQQEFFKRLKKKYPDLTPYDLRLCSYLRMNFMTKEIARLLNISPRGVEIGRYRLRKKLKLKKEQSLSEFLIKEDF